MNILVVTTGGRAEGHGHIQRQSVLARELANRGHYVEFVTLAHTSGSSRLLQFFPGTYPVIVTDLPNMGSVSTYVKAHRGASMVIIDLEHGPARNLLLHAKSDGRKVVVIGGVGFAIHDQKSVDELVDLQIYQGVAVTSMNNERSVKNMLVGAEYVIIDPIYREARNTSGKRDGVLISMGGSDPHNITQLVATKVASLYEDDEVCIVLGPGMKDSNLVDVPGHNVSFTRSPNDLSGLMSSHKYLITALGMTVYEALCLGIPVACTAWSKDHEETAARLADGDYIHYLGLWDNIRWDGLEYDMRKMLTYDDDWNKYVSRGREFIDGLGVQRVADALETL